MKVRRKIMALGTALAMAFVMIASLVMVTDVKADGETVVKTINLAVAAPKSGTKLGEDSEIEIKSLTGAKKIFSMPVKCLPSESANYEYAPDAFPIDVVDGNSYCYELYLTPEDGCVFDIETDPNGALIRNGVTINLTGQEKYEVSTNNGAISSGSMALFIKVKVSDSQGGDDQGGGTDQGGDADQGGSADQGGDADQGVSSDQTPAASSTTTSTVTTLTEGASATIAQADDGSVTFRYDKPLSYFANGGELYIDGNKIGRDQYEYYEGSTIIKLGKELASKLADGAEHAIKVVFNDGTEVNSKITVTPNAAASATAAAATTTKVKSPKTADVLPFVGIAVVFVGATAIGVIAIRRKNS